MRRVVLAFSLLLAIVPKLIAQSGTMVGTSAAGFGTGVVLARDADAPFWNPALLGIQPHSDVRSEPPGSLRALSLSVRRAASRTWIDSAAGLGLLEGGPGPAPAWAPIVAPGGGDDAGGEADVVWISSATGSLALSFSSHAQALGRLTGESSDTVVRSVFSVATLSVAGPAGEVFGVRTRAGITFKGRWVHLHGIGAAAAENGYREVVVRNTPEAAADVGFVLQPGSFVVSAAVSDAVRLSYRPRDGARVRTVSRAPSAELVESESPAVDRSSEEADLAAADRVYRDATPPVVARVGLAHAAGWGEVALGLEHRVSAGGLQAVPASAWSASWRFPSDRVPLRLGVTRGRDSAGWAVAWVAQTCRVPWSASLGRYRPEGGGESMSFSLSFGWRSSNACGAAR